MSTGRCDRGACDIATRKGHCRDPRVLDEEPVFCPWHQNGPEGSLWQAAFLEDALDFQSGEWDVRSVFEHGSIPCHQSWCGKSENLPVGKVPWHQSQNDAQWPERDVTFVRICRHMLICKKLLSIVCKEIAVPGALLNFCFGFNDGFAHFQRSKTCKLSFMFTEVPGDAMQNSPSFSESGFAPAQKSLLCLVKRLVHLVVTIWFKRLNDLFGSRVN